MTVAMLDSFYTALSVPERVEPVIVELFAHLHGLREDLPREAWDAAIRSEFLPHPISAFVHQDPFTWRCFSKPRGYAGDAVMLDHLYGDARLDSATSQLGRAIHCVTTGPRPAREGVRFRRDFIAAEIDRTAAAVRLPVVLSIACGHARELEKSRAIMSGDIARFIGFDQDLESLGSIADRFPGASNGVTTAAGSVRGILSGKVTFDPADLVYASGLYDYLDQPAALRLTQKLFDFTRPGGRLIIANFLNGLPDAGFMEAYMGWNLVYRSPEDVCALAAQFGAKASAEFNRDNEGFVGFVTITKR
jgi:extracellular factor (EF) 3-hydroxypalmitic acid methyl ester biosynthesis protein